MSPWWHPPGTQIISNWGTWNGSLCTCGDRFLEIISLDCTWLLDLVFPYFLSLLILDDCTKCHFSSDCCILCRIFPWNAHYQCVCAWWFSCMAIVLQMKTASLLLRLQFRAVITSRDYRGNCWCFCHFLCYGYNHGEPWIAPDHIFGGVRVWAFSTCSRHCHQHVIIHHHHHFIQPCSTINQPFFNNYQPLIIINRIMPPSPLCQAATFCEIAAGGALLTVLFGPVLSSTAYFVCGQNG